MKILLTGASGFVGRALAERLIQDAELTLVAGPRGTPPPDTPGKRWVKADLTASNFDHRALVDGQDVVVHAAGLAHVRRGSEGDEWARFESVNTTMTDRLAKAAAKAGVDRFVFISSGAVNGIEMPGRPFDESDAPKPTSHYGRSKMLAERRVLDACAGAGMTCALLRPPVLVGAESPGNISLLLKAVQSGIPLPLGGLSNRRSYLAVRNLADLVALCTWHPAAANQVFMAADLPSLSTADIVRMLAQQCGRRSRLIPVPPALLKIAAGAIGRLDSLRPLWASLELDASKARTLLGWAPGQPMDEAFADVVRGKIAP